MVDKILQSVLLIQINKPFLTTFEASVFFEAAKGIENWLSLKPNHHDQN
jgi:hypothetical protein